MTKRTLTIIVLLLLSSVLSAQPMRIAKAFRNYAMREHYRGQPSWSRPFGNYFVFAGDGYNAPEKTWYKLDVIEGVSDTALYRIFDWIKFSGKSYHDSLHKIHPRGRMAWSIPRSKIILCVKLNPKLTNYASAGMQSASKHFPGYFISDSSAATVIAMGINAGNVNDYRYHVVANDSVELVKWSTPKLEQKYGAKQPYGLIGRFTALGKQAVVEVVNIKDYNIRDGVVLDWRTNLKPVISSIQIFTKPQKKTQMGTVSPTNTNKYARYFDKITGAPTDLHFPKDSVISFNICFKNHYAIGYDIYWVSAHDSTGYKRFIASNVRDSVFAVTPQYFDGPGKYELLIYPTGTKRKSQETRIAFKVTGQSFGLKLNYTILQILPYAIILVIAFIIYYLYNKRRLRKLDQQKETANLKLSSVRAQLNPHFMFNALTSIQNLMNQQDSDGANHYLAKFADLTRQVLNATGQEMISLEDELKIINDYLQIEQLRFGFQYTVNVDENINIANTEIPGMLMQPFIENAAKHGISGMLNKGKISIKIIKEHNNLVLTITDNGKGFDADEVNTNGFGLKLGRERVALLNQLYKNQLIELYIGSGKWGTTITITLNGWF